MMNKKIALNDDEGRLLDRDGFLVLEEFIDSAMVLALRTRIAELFVRLGERAGAEFKQEPETDRLANLVNYDELFRWVIAEPKLLTCVR